MKQADAFLIGRRAALDRRHEVRSFGLKRDDKRKEHPKTKHLLQQT
jgi:hypothetical protein